MAIWLRAREEFADNRFQLLFIYIDIYIYVYIPRYYGNRRLRNLISAKSPELLS